MLKLFPTQLFQTAHSIGPCSHMTRLWPFHSSNKSSACLGQGREKGSSLTVPSVVLTMNIHYRDATDCKQRSSRCYWCDSLQLCLLSQDHTGTWYGQSPGIFGECKQRRCPSCLTHSPKTSYGVFQSPDTHQEWVATHSDSESLITCHPWVYSRPFNHILVQFCNLTHSRHRNSQMGTSDWEMIRNLTWFVSKITPSITIPSSMSRIFQNTVPKAYGLSK